MTAERSRAHRRERSDRPDPDDGHGRGAPLDRSRPARLHLRIGSLSLARAEFETLAGRGPIDDGALVDLAEVRWRTGDTILAGEAATTALEHGVDVPIALIITAEAAFAIGRPGEARRLATEPMSARGGTLDALFAGMPRSAVWPPDPADPAPLATTLFGEDKPEPASSATSARPAMGDRTTGAPRTSRRPAPRPRSPAPRSLPRMTGRPPACGITRPDPRI